MFGGFSLKTTYLFKNQIGTFYNYDKIVGK